MKLFVCNICQIILTSSPLPHGRWSYVWGASVHLHCQNFRAVLLQSLLPPHRVQYRSLISNEGVHINDCKSMKIFITEPNSRPVNVQRKRLFTYKTYPYPIRPWNFFYCINKVFSHLQTKIDIFGQAMARTTM